MEWKEIPGYGGYYLASDEGQVARRSAAGLVPLRPRPGGRYLNVALSVDGRRTTMGIHRAMALAFLPNPRGYPQVRHLDDVGTHNVLSNLAWGTPRQNIADRIRNGNDALTNAAADATHCARGLHERMPENLVTRAKADGRTTQTCKPCELERTRASYARNAEKRRADARERIAKETPEQREARLAYQRQYHQTH